MRNCGKFGFTRVNEYCQHERDVSWSLSREASRENCVLAGACGLQDICLEEQSSKVAMPFWLKCLTSGLCERNLAYTPALLDVLFQAMALIHKGAMGPEWIRAPWM